MATEYEKGLCGLIIYSILKKRRKIQKKRIRTLWCQKHLLERDTKLENELPFFPSDFLNDFMDEKTYMELLSLITPLIEKKSTIMRLAISPHQRLTATLKFLVTKMSYEDLRLSTCISSQALGKIIPETCRAIYSILAKDYLKFPQTASQWVSIANDFSSRCQFPNCLGAIGGKHIAISQPSGTGSNFLNYKNFYSMVLMGIANANYEFTYVHFDTNGQSSDDGVTENNPFFDELKSGRLNIPSESPENGLPFVFVADEAFELRKDLLNPYNVNVLDEKKRIFNCRLLRAGRIIENVFGILFTKFGALTCRPSLKREHFKDIVMACCVLHNFLRNKAPDIYTPEGTLDIEHDHYSLYKQGLRAIGRNIAAMENCEGRDASDQAKEARDAFMQYFNNAGAVSHS